MGGERIEFNWKLLTAHMKNRNNGFWMRKGLAIID
jgi:hypothetical protein